MDASETVVPVGRPGGVTAAAAVAILGSLFVLLAGGAFVSIPIPSPEQAFNVRAFSIGMGSVLIALALLGVWTAVGLLNLRPWARMSILAFAVVTTLIAGVSLVFIAFIPLPVPPGKDPNIVRAVRPGMMAMYSVPFLIGVWWLVQFTRPATKAAFAANAGPHDYMRPLSISIIGWLHLVGGVFVLFFIAAGMPMLVGPFALTGWKAQLAYLLLGGISIYIGWGLLKLSETARRVAIAYVGLTWLHGALVSVVPSLREKSIELQKSLRTAGVPQNHASLEPPSIIIGFSVIFALAVAGATVWFLVKNKPAFVKNPVSEIN